MKISYAITVCNELQEIKELLDVLHRNILDQDEIVVLFDKENGTEEVRNYLLIADRGGYINLHENSFNNHFGEWKNLLTSYCSGDYIFQIDADEIPSIDLTDNIHSILEANEVDIVLVPRVNKVTGLTQRHIAKWGWWIDDQDRVNYPDYQWRIYKNNDSIRWIGKVHEKLVGYRTYSTLPPNSNLDLIHIKGIERQEKQNNYYDTLAD